MFAGLSIIRISGNSLNIIDKIYRTKEKIKKYLKLLLILFIMGIYMMNILIDEVMVLLMKGPKVIQRRCY